MKESRQEYLSLLERSERLGLYYSETLSISSNESEEEINDSLQLNHWFHGVTGPKHVLQS